jgi:SAM-dependent methyltransferase
MEILKDYSEVKNARSILRKENLSFIDSKLKYLLRRVRFINDISIGELNKSWDILKFKDFINKNLHKDDPILDVGCYGSEILLSLNAIGFSKLHGIDLNKNISKMPFQSEINYQEQDFMNTTFDDHSFQAITSVSVIEHGFDSKKMFAEMSRLLKLKGYLLVSFDFWPEKIDTSNIKLFGMEWNIFSKDEVLSLIKDASDYNLSPVGELNFQIGKKAISHVGFDYTFGLIIFKKDN